MAGSTWGRNGVGPQALISRDGALRSKQTSNDRLTFHSGENILLTAGFEIPRGPSPGQPSTQASHKSEFLL
jgi:hypothetical protein